MGCNTIPCRSSERDSEADRRIGFILNDDWHYTFQPSSCRPRGGGAHNTPFLRAHPFKSIGVLAVTVALLRSRVLIRGELFLLRQAVNVPVIANGDMYTRADMADIKALSGCRCETEACSAPRPALRFDPNCSGCRACSRRRALSSRRAASTVYTNQGRRKENRGRECLG